MLYLVFSKNRQKYTAAVAVKKKRNEELLNYCKGLGWKTKKEKNQSQQLNQKQMNIDYYNYHKMIVYLLLTQVHIDGSMLHGSQ